MMRRSRPRMPIPIIGILLIQAYYPFSFRGHREMLTHSQMGR